MLSVSQISEQENLISSLTTQNQEQALQLRAQQKVIMDQHAKLNMQEEVIGSMKVKLQSLLESAWEQAEVDASDPSVLCRKVHEVR